MNSPSLALPWKLLPSESLLSFLSCRFCRASWCEGAELKTSVVVKEGLWRVSRMSKYNILQIDTFNCEYMWWIIGIASSVKSSQNWCSILFFFYLLSSLTQSDLEMKLWLFKASVRSIFCDGSSLWKITCTGCIGSKGLHPSLAYISVDSMEFSTVKIAEAYKVWPQFTRSFF